MGFFYTEAKAAPKKAPPKARGPIPIATLERMGCAGCPRDKLEALRTPKMRPSGPRDALVYLLGAAPSTEDDAEDLHWSDRAGAAIYKMFGRAWMEDYVRSNYTTQCAGAEAQEVASACCRQRIIADIEAVKPRIVVGIGDQVLRWAVPELRGSAASALNQRGARFAVRFGTHECWFIPILYPNYVFKQSRRKSEYETVLSLDIEAIKRFAKDPAPVRVAQAPYDGGVELITGREPGDMQRLERALDALAQERTSGVDIETSALRVRRKRDPLLLCAAVGTFRRTVAFSLDHPEGWGGTAQIKIAHRLFRDYLLASGRKAAHNLAMELEWFGYFYGEELLRRTLWDDTMAMAHTLDERKGVKGLEVQVLRAFGFNLKAQANIDLSRSKWWLEYSLERVLRYNGCDAKWTDALRDALEPEIDAVPAYRSEYERKIRTAPTLVIMESLGVPADVRYAEEMLDDLDREAARVETALRKTREVQAYERKFGTFQPTNPQDVLVLLRDICERPEVKVTDRDGNVTGESTGEELLLSIPPAEVPSAPLIIDHRGILKVRSTYIEPIMRREIIDPDGMLRTKYSQMVAETGRFASEDPNLQNWPTRKPAQKRARGVISGINEIVKLIMLACDYGQIEFRVVGMVTQDPRLVEYCWTGYDVHLFWAERFVKAYPKIKDLISREFEVDWDEKGIKTLRQEAKNKWVFPQLFGSSVRACAEQLGIPVEIMQDLSEEFWDDFAVARKWQQEVVRFYERYGYVETLDGRRRRGAMTLNQIINHPIQGTAFSIVCAAQNALSERAQIEERWDRHPRFNGHDDISFFMEEHLVEENVQVIAYEMCKPRFSWVNVPLVVEVSKGERWSEKKEIGKYWSHELFGTPNPYAKKGT